MTDEGLLRLKASIKREITSYSCKVCDKCADAMTDAILTKTKQHYEQKCKECEYDPQAAEFGWFLKQGWLPPAEVKELFKEIEGVIQHKRLTHRSAYSAIVELIEEIQSLKDKYLGGVK